MKRIWALALLLSCSGQVGGLFSTGPGTPGAPGGIGSPGTPGNPSGPGTPPTEEFGPEKPAPSSRAPRLSHEEFENTVQDLLGESAPIGITTDFVKDPSSTLFNNNSGEFAIVGNQWNDYQTAAEEIAKRATASDQALQKAFGAQASGDAKAFIESVGLRIFRRPVTAEEVTAYSALHAKGKEFFPNDDVKRSGARVVLEAMLQSPNFLYRLETGTAQQGDVVALSGYELATRLSYALWQSLPDAALLQAAADQSLLTSQGYTAQVDRLLADGRARKILQRFHAQLLSASKYRDVSRDTKVFPEFNEQLKTSMVTEQTMLIDNVIFAENGTVSSLLTVPYTFADSNLAAVYKLPGNFTAKFDKHTFANKPRQGILTQVGFLASNATAIDSDPIHRGVFINDRIICSNLPSPPNNIPPLPAPDPNAPPKTLRERITDFTGKGTCGAGCHSTYINPIGFAFEKYDALGRDRLAERNGRELDAKDSFEFGDNDTVLTYDGAVELSSQLAQQNSVHRCYAKHLIEFLYGRSSAMNDKALEGRVGLASQKGSLTIKQVVAELVKSNSFTSRLAEQ
jgi:hypothetical protein